MKCFICGERMVCTQSKEHDRKRYRIYKCVSCRYEEATVEMSTVDKDMVKGYINLAKAEEKEAKKNATQTENADKT